MSNIGGGGDIVSCLAKRLWSFQARDLDRPCQLVKWSGSGSGWWWLWLVGVVGVVCCLKFKVTTSILLARPTLAASEVSGYSVRFQQYDLSFPNFVVPKSSFFNLSRYFLSDICWPSASLKNGGWTSTIYHYIITIYCALYKQGEKFGVWAPSSLPPSFRRKLCLCLLLMEKILLWIGPGVLDFPSDLVYCLVI